MSGFLTGNPETFAALTQEFAARLIRDDGSQDMPAWRQMWQQAADFGLLRFGVPEAQGGLDVSFEVLVKTMQALGHGCADNGFTMGLCSHILTVHEPLRVFGTPAQYATYLPNFAAGKSVGAFALTEAGSGSDASNLATTATRDGDGYVLNGTKTLIGMAPACDVALVFASTAPERGAWGLSVFLVEAQDAGFIREAPQEKIGLTTLPMGSLRFENCKIPQDRLLGREGAGASIFQAVMEWERSFILAPHVGSMARQLAECILFARSREVFGQKIIEFQSVSNRLADMRLRLETSELMLEKAARIKDGGKSDTIHAAMTNLHVSESFLASSIDALRIFGGAGYLTGSSVGMDVKDALGGVIYSGTSDVQRQVISKLLKP